VHRFAWSASHTDCRQYLAVSGSSADDCVCDCDGGRLLSAAPAGALTCSARAWITEPRSKRCATACKACYVLGARCNGAGIAPILSTIQGACTSVFEHAGIRGLAGPTVCEQLYGRRLRRDRDRCCRTRHQRLGNRLLDLRPVPDGRSRRMLTGSLSRFEEPYRGNSYQLLQGRGRATARFLAVGNGAVSHRDGRPAS
jgi:hypothetical protein